jgi:hypothetical protein
MPMDEQTAERARRDAEQMRGDLQKVLLRLKNGYAGQLAPHILLRAMTEFWLTIVTEQVDQGTATVDDALVLLDALRVHVLALPVPTVLTSALRI